MPIARLRVRINAAFACLFLVSNFLLATTAGAQSRNLAPNFNGLPSGAKIAVLPTDIELYSISAGGIAEPKADWTETAARNVAAALKEKKAKLGATVIESALDDGDELNEVNALHAAVARSIVVHHFGLVAMRLSTKDGLLDWSLGDGVRTLREKSGADYALFTWIRDSHASSERVATMVMLAALGVLAQGGVQQGYASLVDLRTGQVVWFNRLLRGRGDFREPAKAAESVEALLADFPGIK